MSEQELSREELAIEESKSMGPIFRAAIERRDRDFMAYMEGRREAGSDKAFSSYNDRHILLTLLHEAETALRTAQERVAALEGVYEAAKVADKAFSKYAFSSSASNKLWVKLSDSMAGLWGALEALAAADEQPCSPPTQRRGGEIAE